MGVIFACDFFDRVLFRYVRDPIPTSGIKAIKGSDPQHQARPCLTFKTIGWIKK